MKRKMIITAIILCGGIASPIMGQSDTSKQSSKEKMKNPPAITQGDQDHSKVLIDTSDQPVDKGIPVDTTFGPRNPRHSKTQLDNINIRKGTKVENPKPPVKVKHSQMKDSTKISRPEAK